MTENKKYEKGTLGWLREQAKKDGFDDLSKWNQWKRKTGRILRRVSKSDFNSIAEYEEDLAKRKGFPDRKSYNRERSRIWYNETGRHLPTDIRDDCALNFGVLKGETLFEKFLLTIFEYVRRMKHGNKGFDFICKNPRKEFINKYPQFGFIRDKEYKFDLKTRCLNQAHWCFPIKYNAIADYFILVGWDDRDSLNPLYIWIFHRNDNIRGRLFWRIDTFTITNKPLYLLQFQEHELRDEIDKLKEIIKELKDIGEF